MIPPPVCLTIAGSDPSGGAGIQGDLKTFAAHGVYGMAVVTALTAQNTQQVSGVRGIEPDFVTEQLERVYEDIPTNFIKTGMLLNAGIVGAIARFFGNVSKATLVVDPVMISSSGAELLEPDAVRLYKDQLFPMANLITPNNLETRFITGISVQSVEDAITASHELMKFGPVGVLIKGGDTTFRESENSIYDVLNYKGEIHVLERTLVGSRNSHGTGCAMASAICSQLAWGKSMVEAVDLAGKFVGNALKAAYTTGKGSGSINHLWNMKQLGSIDDNPDRGIS